MKKHQVTQMEDNKMFNQITTTVVTAAIMINTASTIVKFINSRRSNNQVKALEVNVMKDITPKENKV